MCVCVRYHKIKQRKNETSYFMKLTLLFALQNLGDQSEDKNHCLQNYVIAKVTTGQGDKVMKISFVTPIRTILIFNLPK